MSLQREVHHGMLTITKSEKQHTHRGVTHNMSTVKVKLIFHFVTLKLLQQQKIVILSFPPTKVSIFIITLGEF